MISKGLKHSLVIFTGFFIAYCIPPESTLAQQRPLFDPDYRALVPATRAMKMVSCGGGGCSTMQETLKGLAVASTWEVSPEQADSIEPMLAAKLYQAIHSSDWIPPTMKAANNYEEIGNHALQFAGVIIDGKQSILIVGAEAQMYDFSGVSPVYPPKGKWRDDTRAVGICDGAPSNFSVLYDVEAKTFVPFALSKIGGLGTYIPTTRFRELH